jgi:energy-coupling factor transporter ATP-binding protein EcfA2
MALLGDNGSGKTTCLQALALTLSLATRRTREPQSFDWHGFLPERVPSMGPTRVELVVEFHPDEIAATNELFKEWEASLPSDKRQTMRIILPADHLQVPIVYEKGHVSSPLGMAAVNQFLGRYYIKKLAATRPSVRDNFKMLGDIFWFDQHRNLGTRGFSDTAPYRAGLSTAEPPREGWQAGVEQLREYLVGWWGYHTTALANRNGKDYIPLLEQHMDRIFPGTRFIGLGQRETMTEARANDFYFLLNRDNRVYDLAEMSSGEQAVFPLVYNFVRLDISKSIVLIDELELHLHAPEQQRLLAALPKIGPDCQFVISTHSEFLSSAIPNEQTVRLERGTRCL